jgi:hypothetical protein
MENVHVSSDLVHYVFFAPRSVLKEIQLKKKKFSYWEEAKHGLDHTYEYNTQFRRNVLRSSGN